MMSNLNLNLNLNRALGATLLLLAAAYPLLALWAISTWRVALP